MRRQFTLSPRQRTAAIFGFSSLALVGLAGGIYSINAAAEGENDFTIFLHGADSVQQISTGQATAWTATYNIRGQEITIGFHSGVPLTQVQDGDSYLTVTTQGYAPGQYINFDSNTDLTGYEIYLRERVNDAPAIININCAYENESSICADDSNANPTAQAGKSYDLVINKPHTGAYIVDINAQSFSNDNLSATFEIGEENKTITFPSAYITANESHPHFEFDQVNSIKGLTFSSDNCVDEPYHFKIQATDGWWRDFTCNNGNYSLPFGENEGIPDDDFELLFYNSSQNPDPGDPGNNLGNTTNYAIFYDNLNENSTESYAAFTVGEASVGLTIHGTTLDLQLGRSGVDHDALFAANSDIYFELDNNFDPSSMQVIIRGGEDFSQILTPTNNIIRLSGTNVPGDSVHIAIEPKSGDDQPGPERPQHPGERQNTHITVRSSDAAHRGSYTDSGVFLNDEGFHLDKCEENAESCSFDFAYNYDEENDNGKVTFEFGATFLSKFVNRVIINDVPFNIPIDYTDEFSCLTHFEGQGLTFYIQADKADSYDIVYDIEPLDFEGTDVICVSNFLWTSNEEAKGTDEYIGHSRLELLSVEWTPLDNSEPIVIAGEALAGELTEAQKAKGMVLEYDPGDDHHAGSLVVPADAIATMKIVPEYGYQVTSFGINEQAVFTGDAISEFSFPVGRGNYHLGANVTKVSDAVESATEKVTSGSIELGGAEIADGTALLTVSDADINEDQISNFKNAADGYNVSTFLDINLGQVFYKGDGDYWEGAEMKELIHDATVTLKLADGVDGNTVVIVHEKHDGTYEVIPTTYNAKTHTITFKTSSFSNYAIASTTINNANTLDGITKYFALFVLSSAAAIFVASKKEQASASE